MSLRYQINLRILISSLCILLLGGSIAIWQARDAVEKEFLTLDEREQSVRTVTAKLETGFLRRFANFKHE